HHAERPQIAGREGERPGDKQTGRGTHGAPGALIRPQPSPSALTRRAGASGGTQSPAAPPVWDGGYRGRVPGRATAVACLAVRGGGAGVVVAVAVGETERPDAGVVCLHRGAVTPVNCQRQLIPLVEIDQPTAEGGHPSLVNHRGDGNVGNLRG